MANFSILAKILENTFCNSFSVLDVFDNFQDSNVDLRWSYTLEFFVEFLTRIKVKLFSCLISCSLRFQYVVKLPRYSKFKEQKVLFVDGISRQRIMIAKRDNF